MVNDCKNNESLLAQVGYTKIFWGYGPEAYLENFTIEHVV